MVKKYGIEILGYESCNMKRRKFIKDTSFLIGGLSLPFVGSSFLSGCSNQPAFKISLAEWSLHRALRSKNIDHLDFISLTKTEFGLDAVEYVNSFFFDKAQDQKLQANILTFFPHPRMVLQKDISIKLIDTVDEKILIFKKMGVDILVIHPFTISFSKLGPIEFTQDILVKIFKIHKLFIGFDHRFGKNREASVDDLVKFGPKYNFNCLLYTSPSPRDLSTSRMPSSA